ncbi:alpha/beta fold hydrolase [Chelatococcus reniformis]|uniref:Epoxide hydrolase n=1 Tax=Chelatococcus reniformis TaxID=1494448 RepID=A0A916U3G8_9HYPH|nr:alpha/beta hydrolase [Chelatococcus reniformis]GGC58655.1 epoxide hydrolase [Chelatococcus reniformis]
MDIRRRALCLGAASAAIVGPARSTIAAGREDGAVQAAPSPLPAGAASRFARINGMDAHYVIAGSGPLVILLHGWPQTWFAWSETIRRLSAAYTVVAPDLRGTGLSERTPEGYDKRTIAEDTRALMAHLGVAQAHIVAHDMGGKAAYVLAHVEPTCVAKLILVDCLIPGTENTDALRGGAWHYGFHMAPDVPEMLTEGRERAYIRAQVRAWSHRKDAISEEAITEYARFYAQPGGMTAGFNFYRALPQDAALAASFGDRTLPMPVLTIGGQHSAGSRLFDALHGKAPRLTGAIAADSGHFVAEEVPEVFNDLVQRFLAG